MSTRQLFNKHILVTGGAGFIGSNLIERLTKMGANVVVVDNLWRGKIENLIDNNRSVIDLKNKFYKLDLRDYSNCRKVISNFDIVFHLADVVAGINYVFGNQFSLYCDNTIIDTNVLKASIEANVDKFVYVGTACSYPKEKQDTLNTQPLNEEDVYPANPESSYGWSKLMGEYECELAQNEGLLNIGLLRLHNVYGPKSDFSPDRSQVIPSLIRKAINIPKEDFIVWGSGNQRRAFVYVNDVVDALISIVENGMGKGPIQIGPGFSISIKEIAEIIASISGKNINIIYDSSKREGDIDRSADWTKAREILGWSPRTNIAEGLKLTYEWFKSVI